MVNDERNAAHYKNKRRYLQHLNSRTQQIEWRRHQVLELSSKGYSQSEIARTLQIDESIISRDVAILREQSKQHIKRYIDERLPEEYENLGWYIFNTKEACDSVNSKDGKDKLHALSLAKDCYSMKLELLTNATIVEDALKFVENNQPNTTAKDKLPPNVKIENKEDYPTENNDIVI